MSTSYVLIVFAVVIALMIILISKCKVNAAMGILVSALILSVALKTPWEKIESTINSGFSGTIKSVAIVIVLGCTMGTVLEKNLIFLYLPCINVICTFRFVLCRFLMTMLH